jgi:hypothetical protein
MKNLITLWVLGFKASGFSVQVSTIKKFQITDSIGVHGFKGSGVQGSILIPGLYLGCVFTRKTSASSSQI